MYFYLIFQIILFRPRIARLLGRSAWWTAGILFGIIFRKLLNSFFIYLSHTLTQGFWIRKFELDCMSAHLLLGHSLSLRSSLLNLHFALSCWLIFFRYFTSHKSVSFLIWCILLMASMRLYLNLFSFLCLCKLSILFSHMISYSYNNFFFSQCKGVCVVWPMVHTDWHDRGNEGRRWICWEGEL